MRHACLVAIAGLSLAGCGDKIDAVQDTPCSLQGPVTYQVDIQPILDTLCTGCHASTLSGSARNGAPTSVNLDSFAGASAAADQANTRIQNETMPPSGTRASAAQKELFQCWVDGGTKEAP